MPEKTYFWVFGVVFSTPTTFTLVLYVTLVAEHHKELHLRYCEVPRYVSVYTVYLKISLFGAKKFFSFCKNTLKKYRGACVLGCLQSIKTPKTATI